MREIKFRAWDTIENLMADGEIIETVMQPDEMNVYHAGLSYGVFFVGRFDSNGDWHKLPTMQFTGFCDKNGKEIYEGDVVTIPDSTYCPDRSAAVIFRDGTFKFDRPMRGAQFRDTAFCGNAVVIGNIYENPDLTGASNE